MKEMTEARTSMWQQRWREVDGVKHHSEGRIKKGKGKWDMASVFSEFTVQERRNMWTCIAIKTSSFHPHHESLRQIPIFLFCKYSVADAVGCPLGSHSPTFSLLAEPHVVRCSATGVNHDWPSAALATQHSSACDWSRVGPQPHFWWDVSGWGGTWIFLHIVERHRRRKSSCCCPPSALCFKCYQLRT